MPIPYPDNLTPDEPPYFIVALNETWYSVVWGVLADALGRWNWSVSDEQWVDIEQAVLKVMAMSSACDPCSISIEIDVDGKLILNLSPDISVEIETPFLHGLSYDEDTQKWSWKVGDTVYNSSAVSNVYPQIDKGLEPPDFDIDTVDPRDHICAGVTQVVAWLVDVWSDMAAETQLYLDAIKTAREAVTGIVEFLTGGAAELLPVDELWGFVTSMAQTELDLFTQKYNSVQFKDDITEALYCRIVGNANKFDENVFVEWAGDVHDFGGFPPLDWRNNLIQVVTWHRTSAKYALYSIDVENDCRLAEWCFTGWQYEFDFADGKQGWQEMDEAGYRAGTWEGDSFLAENGALYTGQPTWRMKRCDIERIWQTPTTIVQCAVTYDYTAATNANQQPINFGRMSWQTYDTSEEFSHAVGSNQVASESRTEFGVTRFELTDVVGSRSDGVPIDGEIRIKKITLYGEGYNPFQNGE